MTYRVAPRTLTNAATHPTASRPTLSAPTRPAPSPARASPATCLHLVQTCTRRAACCHVSCAGWHQLPVAFICDILLACAWPSLPRVVVMLLLLLHAACPAPPVQSLAHGTWACGAAAPQSGGSCAGICSNGFVGAPRLVCTSAGAYAAIATEQCRLSNSECSCCTAASFMRTSDACISTCCARSAWQASSQLTQHARPAACAR